MAARPRHAAEIVRSAAAGAGVTIAVVAVAFAGIGGLLALVTRNAYGGPEAWIGAAVVLTAGALGVPTHFAMSSSVTSTGIGFLNADTSSTPKFTVTTSVDGEVRATVWLVTLAFAVLLAFVARRSESARPSTSAMRLAVRVLAAAAGSSAALYLLALAARGPNALVFKAATVFSLAVAPGPGGRVQGTVSIDAVRVFVGPLLIALAAAAIGRMVAVARRDTAASGSTADSTSTAARLATTWRGPAAVAWLQLRAVAVLSAAVLLFTAIDGVVRSSSSSSNTTKQVLGLIPFAGNLGVGGGLLGFGATLFHRLSPSSGAGALPGFSASRSVEVGFASGQRPVVLYALLAAAFLGTAWPALKLRLRPKPGDRDVHGRPQLWRAAVLGAAAGFAAALPGQLTVLSTSTTVGSFGGVGTPGVPRRYDGQYGFSVAGSIAACALWCALAYLGVLVVGTRGPVPVPPRGKRARAAGASGIAPDAALTPKPDDDAQLALLDADPLAAEPLEMLPDRRDA